MARLYGVGQGLSDGGLSVGDLSDGGMTDGGMTDGGLSVGGMSEWTTGAEGSRPVGKTLTMTDSTTWRIDSGVAHELAARMGWKPDDGVPALVSAIAAFVPAGSIAKREALASGNLPPGSDPGAIARQLLTETDLRRSTASFSCWPFVTLTAALASTLELGPVEVLATRRCTNDPALIDFHGALLISDADGVSWIADPYFAAVAPGPGSHEVEFGHRGVWTHRADREDGRFAYWLAHGRWQNRLRFRVYARHLDVSDVAMHCALSVHHSGLPTTRGNRIWQSDVVVDLWEDTRNDPTGDVTGDPTGDVTGDVPATLRTWTRDSAGSLWDGSIAVMTNLAWDEACGRFFELTGVRVR